MAVTDGDRDDAAEQVQITLSLVVEEKLLFSLHNQERFFIISDKRRTKLGLSRFDDRSIICGLFSGLLCS